MSATVQQVVNGHIYSWSSIELEIGNGQVFAGVKSISYADNIKPGVIYGTGGITVGRTPGKNTPTLEIEVYRREWDALRAELAKQGQTDTVFGTKPVNVRVNYSEPAIKGVADSEAQCVTDYLYGVRVVGVSSNGSLGTEASTVKLTCSINRINWGGAGQGEGATAMKIEYPGEQPWDGATAKPHADEGDRANGPPGAAFWANSGDGFEGEVFATNPWDSVKLADRRLPGVCKISGVAAEIIERQKPNGRDAAALIMRGYSQPEIEIEMLIWTPEQWREWQDVEATIWRHPNKSSVFEEPKQSPVPTPGASKLVTQQAAVDKANQANAVIAREQQAIRSSKAATTRAAIPIYHPGLQRLGVANVIVESISIPVAGPEPQTFVVKVKVVEHLEQVTVNATSRAKGSKSKAPDAAPSVKPPLNFTPVETEGSPNMSSIR